MKNKKADKVAKSEQKFYAAQGDVESITTTIKQLDDYTLARGRLRTQYVKEDSRFERLQDSVIESQTMLINMLRQKVGAPDGYVLDMTSAEFIPAPSFDNTGKNVSGK